MGIAAAAALLLAATALAGSTAAEEGTAWDRAYDAAASTRFIPVQLWTGGDWDGSRVIRMTPADLVFGSREQKSVRGPFAWAHPVTGQTFQVYERLNSGKRQLFTVTNDGTGLGRVFDSRYKDLCAGEVKFPLGYWKQGESRSYIVSCQPRGRARPLIVTILDLDFVYDGVQHSLRFHWLMNEGKGRGTDMMYVYSPGRGLVHLDGNE